MTTTSVVTPATCFALIDTCVSASADVSRDRRLTLRVRIPSSFIRFSLLCSVFRLMPRISAARVLLFRVCSSVSMISRRSASSTVVPGAIVSVGSVSSPARDERRRQVPRLDELAVGEDRRALDDVAQLADVAGPGIVLEHVHRVLVDAADRLAVASG